MKSLQKKKKLKRNLLARQRILEYKSEKERMTTLVLLFLMFFYYIQALVYIKIKVFGYINSY